MSAERYAVYYVPPQGSALATFGQKWLGVDIETGISVKQLEITSLSPSRLEAITSTPRLYGFHGTLKPPFSLAKNTSPEGLLDATRILARSLSKIEIPPLELAFIGKFLALSPETASMQLEKLASNCVRALEGFRQRRSERELAEYRQAKLTVHQEQMLDNWGYPYVLEEFRFHMTLTEKIETAAERETLMKTAKEKCRDIIGQPIPITEITVCRQNNAHEPMQVVERVRLGQS
jgi:putative phosphonate metabolism protein